MSRLTTSWLSGALLICWISFQPAPSIAQTRQDAEGQQRIVTQETEAIVKAIHKRTNRFRERQGLQRLKPHTDLQNAAMDFAEYMARTEKYGHEADGRQPAERASAAGYQYCRVAENIAYRYRSRQLLEEELGKLFMQGWKQSPGHRENLLDRDVTEMGIGIAFGESMKRVYAVHLFGRPRSNQIELLVTNKSERNATLEVSSDAAHASNTAPQKIELPSRSRVEITRCYPTALRMVDANAAQRSKAQERSSESPELIRVDESAEFVIRVSSADDSLKLVRRR